MLELIQEYIQSLNLNSDFAKYFVVFLISMLPVVELRGAVPVGVVVLGLPVLPVLIVSVIGDMIPVPFIIIFIRKIFIWISNKNEKLNRIVKKLEAKAKKKGEILYKYEILGLMVLVAIPLPGTGAWTGALVASIFDIRLKVTIPTIFAGVVVAGIIMSLFSHGVWALIA